MAPLSCIRGFETLVLSECACHASYCCQHVGVLLHTNIGHSGAVVLLCSAVDRSGIGT